MPNIGKLNKKKVSKDSKVIFIDRDGVINQDPIGDYIKTWSQFEFLPGVFSSLRKLTKAGYSILIVSNQAGVGDGIYSRAALHFITKKMLARLAQSGIKIKGIYYCLHGKQAGCHCRKPKTGLFVRAAKKNKFNPRKTFFIGDKASDVLAGKRFKLKTAFVLTGHGSLDLRQLHGKLKPDLIAKNLSSAVSKILQASPASR